MISAVPSAPASVEAVIVATPQPMPRTSPDPPTAATRVSPDDQANRAPATAWPFASVACAESLSVSPTTSVSAAGDTLTARIAWATVTATLPAADGVRLTVVGRGGSGGGDGSVPPSPQAKAHRTAVNAAEAMGDGARVAHRKLPRNCLPARGGHLRFRGGHLRSRFLIHLSLHTPAKDRGFAAGGK